MDPGQASDNHIVLEDAVPGNRRRVHDNHPIPDQRVMCDMASSHKEAVITNPRDTATTFGAAIHRHMLADPVARPDLEPTLFALEFQVLGHFANHRERENRGARANGCLTGHNHMRLERHFRRNAHMRPHHAKRTDGGTGVNLGARFDHRRRVHPRHQLGKSIMAVNSTSQAMSPSTSALPANFQTLPPGLPRVVRSFSSSLSPGTTILRNLHLSMAMK